MTVWARSVEVSTLSVIFKLAILIRCKAVESTYCPKTPPSQGALEDFPTCERRTRFDHHIEESPITARQAAMQDIDPDWNIEEEPITRVLGASQK
jgi:hypothetical protein